MIVRHSRGEYPVDFGPFPGGERLVVTDSNVVALYDLPNAIVVDAGETSKRLETYGEVAREAIRRGASRKQAIWAVGGGVVGDLAGFVAATLLRGVPLVQVPTTLLAMVDSSLGGKVGIDVPEGKNLLGAFHPPQRVIVDGDFLKTLPAREHRAGMAESIKHGLIRDTALLEDICKRPLAVTLSNDLIKRAIQVKVDVVQADEFETKGIRAQLNAGHTLAHALEQVLNYDELLHGEAVAIGLYQETKFAESLGLAKSGTAQIVADALRREQLPIHHPALTQVEPLLEAMRRDKKTTGNGLAFSFVLEPGTCKLFDDVREADVAQYLRQR